MKFIALTEATSAEEDDAFRTYLKKEGWGYWHWLPGSWLLDTPAQKELSGEVALLTEIRDQLLRVAPNKWCLVIRVEPGHYFTGFGPQSEKEHMFQWLDSNWVKKN